MKFTLNWLKDHLEFNEPVDVLINALTNLGIEVENVTNYLEKLDKFSLGYIKSAAPHPNADKLKVCQVDTISGTLQIVCGASNARAGIYVIFADVGTYIASSNTTLKAAEIRGVASNGMMLSERELELSNEHEGIIELATGKVGESAAVALGLNDIVFDIAITPNRGDLLGVRGIAKDLQAVGFGKLKKLSYKTPKAKGDSKITLQIDSTVSKKFLVQKITEVTNKKSPAWLANRLKLIGLEPRNALVDITNYICVDLNQPLHCYDADKISQHSPLKVELAASKSKFKALDENEYILSSISPIISFGEQIGCIAGIKGSFSTRVDITTTNILLESAHFDSKVVALAKRELGINTDSSYRFEREIDIANIEYALQAATALIAEICGGNFCMPTKYEQKTSPVPLLVDLQYLQQLSGMILPPQEIQTILEKLGCTLKYTKEQFQVTPPNYRPDINDRSDILSEIIRVKGVEAMPQFTNVVPYSLQPTMESNFAKKMQGKRSLANLGLLETINMSFISDELAKDFGIYDADLALDNPISRELTMMRKSLMPSLCNIAKSNINNSYSNQRIFEVANIYNSSTNYENSLGFLLGGNLYNKSWQHQETPYSVWHAKEIIFKIIEDLGFNPKNLLIIQEDLPVYYHGAKAGKLTMGKLIIGYFGELHPAVLQAQGINQPLFGGEIFSERLPIGKNKISKTPIMLANIMPVRRDFAFVVPKNTRAGEIIKIITAVDKKTISSVNIFDIFESPQIGVDKKSVALSVTLQAVNQTFSEEEIMGLSDKIVTSMAKTLGAYLRTE